MLQALPVLLLGLILLYAIVMAVVSIAVLVKDGKSRVGLTEEKIVSKKLKNELSSLYSLTSGIQEFIRGKRSSVLLNDEEQKLLERAFKAGEIAKQESINVEKIITNTAREQIESINADLERVQYLCKEYHSHTGSLQKRIKDLYEEEREYLFAKIQISVESLEQENQLFREHLEEIHFEEIKNNYLSL